MTKPCGELGFTGTQDGTMPRQLKALRQLLYDITHLHIGDCNGADAEAHFECGLLGITRIGHPPSDIRKRAFLTYEVERPALPYLARNKVIVREGLNGLIATPRGWTEELRSGTWTTVRYARLARRQIWIIRPDGSVLYEDTQRIVIGRAT